MPVVIIPERGQFYVSRIPWVVKIPYQIQIQAGRTHALRHPTAEVNLQITANSILSKNSLLYYLYSKIFRFTVHRFMSLILLSDWLIPHQVGKKWSS